MKGNIRIILKEKIREFNIVSKIILLIPILLICFHITTYSYWLVISDEIKIKTMSLNIGQWVRNAVVYDPENPVDVEQGTIVITMIDGVETVFYALEATDASDPLNNPANSNTSFWSSMKYCESTPEYRTFHRYIKGDLVIFEGKLYEYNSIIRHNPNTVSQLSPAQNAGRWKLRNDLDPDKSFYIHVIYYKDDEVIYEGKRFKCTAEFSVMGYPGYNSGENSWVQI